MATRNKLVTLDDLEGGDAEVEAAIAPRFSRLASSYTVDVMDAGIEASAVEVSNTVAITPLYSAVIPGGTLEVGGRIRAVFSGRIYNNSGAAQDWMFSFPWGNGYALVAGAAINLGTTTSPRMWRAEVDGVVIFDGPGHAGGVVDAQDADTRFTSLVTVGGPAPATTEQRPVTNQNVGKGLSVRNLTEDLAFGINVQHAVASAEVRTTLDFGYVEVIGLVR